MKTLTMVKALKHMRTRLEKDSIPAQWLEYFLLIGSTNGKGLTTKEVNDEAGFKQASAIHMLKQMMRLPGKITGQLCGADVFHKDRDSFNLKMDRVFLTKNGQELFDEVLRILNNGE